MVRDGKHRRAREVDQFTELFRHECRFEGNAPSNDGDMVDSGACKDVKDGRRARGACRRCQAGRFRSNDGHMGEGGGREGCCVTNIMGE